MRSYTAKDEEDLIKQIESDPEINKGWESTPSTVSSEFVADTTKVNPELAARSHMGTSWDPEKRAQQEIEGFAVYVQGVYDALKTHTKTEAQKAFLDTEIKRFQDSFANKYNDLLAAKGRTMSTFITGGSGFDVRRADKANAAERSRYAEMIEFRDRAQAAILRELKKMAVEEAGGELEVLKKKIEQAEKLQEMMVEGNKIVRKKAEPGPGGISKEQQLINLGFTEKRAREALKPDYMGRFGFPSYALTNNSANIRRMKERVKELERKEATPSGDIKFEGGSIKDNATEDRVQIFFDKKPEQAMIEKLKGEGWRWSPSNSTWQRKRTDQAIWSAERILGIKIIRERFVPVKIDHARALYEAVQREKGETAGVKTANYISIIQKLDNLPLRQQEVNRAKLLLSSLPNLTFDELIALEKTVKQWGVTIPQIKYEIDALYKEYLELRKPKTPFVSTAPDKLVTITEKEYDKPVIPYTTPPPQAVIELRWVYGTQDQKWHLVGPGDRDYAHGITQERMKIIGPDAARAEYLSPSFAQVPEPTDYFTLKKAQALTKENKLLLSDQQLHEKTIRVQDYIRLIEATDEYSLKTLVKGGYYAGVIHPDATGMVPVDIWLLQSLKFTLAEFDKERQRRTQEKIKPTPTTVTVAKPVQSTQDIKQQLLNSIQAARSIEELQPILKGIGFMPLPELEKRQVMDLYQNRYSLLSDQRSFGERMPVEEKPKFIGAPTKQELAEAELRRKAEEGKKLRGQVELGGAVSTATRLGLFEPGAMDKAKAEAEARRRIEQLGLPSTTHPVIKRLAESPQEVLKFGNKRAKDTIEDIVLKRYVQYCPPGTIIDNRNVPKVIERWWVYPPKLRTCILQVEQKLAGAGMVKESQRYRYSIYQDGRLFANEDDPTEANNIYTMLVRTYPISAVELRENFVHPRIHQKPLKKYPAYMENPVAPGW